MSPPSNQERPLTITASVGREPSRRAALHQAVRDAFEGIPRQFDLRLPVGRSQLLEMLPGSDVLFSFRLDDEILEAGCDLRWIQLGVSGVDQNLPSGIESRKILLTNTRQIHGRHMTEYVLGVILAHSNALFRCRDSQRARSWASRSLLPTISSVQGSTMGILGLGSVGKTLAQAASGLGMRVLASRRHPAKDEKIEGVEEVFGPDGIDSILERADWLVLLLPLTEETKGILNRARISRMKKGSYLINVGRGGLVDEKALYNALVSKRLGGAALDVFRTEPLPESSDFWDLPNVLVTPHIAGNFPQYLEAAAERFQANLRRYLCGEELEDRVQVNLGY